MIEKSRLTTTVAIATRDRPGQLRTLLQSLVGQTLAPDEVLIVDNNSTASYEAVFEEYRSRLPLRMVVEKRPGVACARNRAIEEATGDIIAFTDDDCEAEPEWLENITRPFYQNPHIGQVGGEITSRRQSNSLVEEFCVAENLMRVGRQEVEA